MSSFVFSFCTLLLIKMLVRRAHGLNIRRISKEEKPDSPFESSGRNREVLGSKEALLPGITHSMGSVMWQEELSR